jgi:hypothetical protein
MMFPYNISKTIPLLNPCNFKPTSKMISYIWTMCHEAAQKSVFIKTQPINKTEKGDKVFHET